MLTSLDTALAVVTRPVESLRGAIGFIARLGFTARKGEARRRHASYASEGSHTMEVRRRTSDERARAFLEKIEKREQDESKEELRDERRAYAEAQESITDARRSAELHEGLLRIP